MILIHSQSRSTGHPFVFTLLSRVSCLCWWAFLEQVIESRKCRRTISWSYPQAPTARGEWCIRATPGSTHTVVVSTVPSRRSSPERQGVCAANLSLYLRFFCSWPVDRRSLVLSCHSMGYRESGDTLDWWTPLIFHTRTHAHTHALLTSNTLARPHVA